MAMKPGQLRSRFLIPTGMLMLAGFVDAAPAILSRQQIEADWAVQDKLRASESPVAPQQDAAGACDGIKDGQWGFHTQHEDRPWWQIDLGQPYELDCLHLYNRTEFAQRAARLIVLVSEDGKDFRQVYQHDGTVFLGHADGRPLKVPLHAIAARFVRLQLPGRDYFHLDEIEIYPVGGGTNIAPGKSCTQSSISQWSRKHGGPDGATASADQVAERGLRLAERLREMGVDTTAKVAALKATAGPADRDRDASQRARWLVRDMALANPLLDFDSILFLKRAPGTLPHISDQYYGWWSRPGGGLYILNDFKTATPHLRCLIDGWPEGSFLRPDLSYDGKKVLFAYCRYYPEVSKMAKVDKTKLPEGAFYHIYEMNLDGTGLRQLTHGRYDDFDPRYLPNGDIVFLSTRKGIFLQCATANTAGTLAGTLPDSYVRCGGDNVRPCAIFTLHTMNAHGANLRPISAFESFEYTPSVADDGRILYTRWDYIDRFNGHFFSLWSVNQDGTNPQLVYGNYTVKPQAVLEACSVPHSNRILFTAAAHHSTVGGSLVLLDRSRGDEYEAPLTRVTPEVPFPETEAWPGTYYANPYPLSENFYLVAWSTRKLPPHAGSAQITDDRNPPNALGLYLCDRFGNLELLYRDERISSMYPIPIRPRPKPPTGATEVDWDGVQEGSLLVQDIYQGLTGIAPGTVKRLRIVAVPPKVQPHMNQPTIGVSAEDPGKYVLGTVPVASDGSAFFRIPSGVPVFFQALDDKGLALQTMRSLTYVLPGQTLSCVGCHESRDQAPLVSRMPLAARNGPSKLTPGPDGSWPLRFDRLVQPVLDKLCVECHGRSVSDAKRVLVERAPRGMGFQPMNHRQDADATESHGQDARATSQIPSKAARFDLTGKNAYRNLLTFAGKDLEKLAFEKDQSEVGQGPARDSKLLALLAQDPTHRPIVLDRDSMERLATWMDTYAHRQGHFSSEQETQLIAFKERYRHLFDH